MRYATAAVIIVGVAIGFAGARTAAMIAIGGGVLVVAVAADWDLRRRGR